MSPRSRKPKLPHGQAAGTPCPASRGTGRRLGFMEVLAAALLALLPACGLLRAPQKVVKEVVPAKRSSQPDPLDLQLQLQRYADDFLTKYGQALDDYAQRVGTEPTRVEALQLKLVSSSSVVSIVSGPNPIVNLLDLVSVAVLTRMSIEEYWLRTPNGPAFSPGSRSARGWRPTPGCLQVEY